MNRIVLVGTSTPIIKVLERLEDYAEGLELMVLFGDSAPGGQVARSARRLGLELRSIDQLRRDDGVATLRTDAPDWLLNVNSTFIFGPELLAVPMRGCLNMHPGKLPEYAGLHTHQWAIRNGDSRFAATLHWMESEVDAGPIAYEREFDIAPDDTGLSLLMRCLNAGVEVVLEAVRDIAAGRTPPRIPQDRSRRRVYRHGDALDGSIDWALPARRIVDFVRAADYRPFQSPTYSPITRAGGVVFTVRKLEEMQAAVRSVPGTVLAVKDKASWSRRGQEPVPS